MKNLILIALFFSCMGNAQFFENDNTQQEEETQDYGFSEDSPVYDEPDQGLDSSGNPGDPVPIDGWTYILPIIGIGLGVYYLRDRRKWA